MYSTKYCCEFFLGNEVCKIKPSCNPEKGTLGSINSHSFNNALSLFLGTRKSKQTLNIDNYFTSFNVKLAFVTYMSRRYKVVLRLAGGFSFPLMTLPLNKFAHPWFILCVNKDECKRSIAANKTDCLKQCSL